jgi:anti-anti-sigma factor
VADQRTAGNGGELRIVTLPAHIDIGNARSVAEELEKIFDTGVALVIADLTGTQTCSAAGVHELDLAHQRATARNIDLRLVIPPGEALRVFALTGHDRWLPIYPDLAAALPDPDLALPGRAQQDVFQRIDRHDGVELALIREVLQATMLHRIGKFARPGPGQHAGRLVGARYPHAPAVIWAKYLPVPQGASSTGVVTAVSARRRASSAPQICSSSSVADTKSLMTHC